MGGLISLICAAGLAQASAASPQPTSTKSLPTSVDELVVTAPSQKPAPKLNLDVKGDFAPRAIPYLRQRPVDGCKPMAGGATSVTGQSGLAGGIVCAMRF
jgi:hypothetical protein